MLALLHFIVSVLHPWVGLEKAQKRIDLGAQRSQNIEGKPRLGAKLMMRCRFVPHPRRYAGDRPVGLRNDDQLSIAVGVLPENENILAATRMERVVNPPLNKVLAGSMSLLRTAPESRECRCRAQ